MRNSDLEQQLARAAADAAPDVLGCVLSRCDLQKGRNTDMTETIHTQKRKGVKWQAFAGLAAAVLIAAAGFGYYTQVLKVDSVIGFDVNPSIELEVSQREKVLGVSTLNEDAVRVLDSMDLTGSNLDVAVNALIGSMMKNGYIDELKNSILVTVENHDLAKSTELQQRIVEEIDSILSSNQITGSILSQSLEENNQESDLRTLADTYQISTGKAAFIQEIVRENPTLAFEDLAGRSIYELNLIAETKNLNLENVASTGSASDKAYIGEEAALNAALSHAGIAQDEAATEKIKLDWDDGIVEYEVEFYTTDAEYEYDINALTGEVLSYQTEPYHRQTSGTGGSAGQDGVSQGNSGVRQPDSQTPDSQTPNSQTPGFQTPASGNAGSGELPPSGQNHSGGNHTNENPSDAYHKNENHADLEHNGYGTSGSADAYIGEDAMLQIIQDKAPGAVMKEWELDEDDGFIVYEGEVMSGNMEYEFKIDAFTGEILKWKQDD